MALLPILSQSRIWSNEGRYNGNGGGIIFEIGGGCKSYIFGKPV